METEIPRFALTIAQNLENDRDVLKILSSYRRMAGKDFAQELDQTVADMKTGNYETLLSGLKAVLAARCCLMWYEALSVRSGGMTRGCTFA